MLMIEPPGQRARAHLGRRDQERSREIDAESAAEHRERACAATLHGLDVAAVSSVDIAEDAGGAVRAPVQSIRAQFTPECNDPTREARCNEWNGVGTAPPERPIEGKCAR